MAYLISLHWYNTLSINVWYFQNEYVFSCQAVAQYIKFEPEDVYVNPEAKNDTMDENIYANT